MVSTFLKYEILGQLETNFETNDKRLVAYTDIYLYIFWTSSATTKDQKLFQYLKLIVTF